MRKATPTIDTGSCMACGICVAACPFSCLALVPFVRDRYRKAYPQLSRAEACTGCAICEKECPFDAIKMVAAIKGPA
jgi:formate hydrogenlyase subunit 6/NADH:ubiquinone oxidoreductase subunit I